MLRQAHCCFVATPQRAAGRDRHAEVAHHATRGHSIEKLGVSVHRYVVRINGQVPAVLRPTNQFRPCNEPYMFADIIMQINILRTQHIIQQGSWNQARMLCGLKNRLKCENALFCHQIESVICVKRNGCETNGIIWIAKQMGSFGLPNKWDHLDAKQMGSFGLPNKWDHLDVKQMGSFGCETNGIIWMWNKWDLLYTTQLFTNVKSRPH